tara:strand:+ start:108 stop:371 length:264 start_codon:yes stop_codon:yes gene_type:complete
MSKLNDLMLQWGTDKFLHFMGGAAGYAITESWVVLCIMAFGKELYDHIDHKAWSNADVFATCLGGACAFIGIFCWDFITIKLPFIIY